MSRLLSILAACLSLAFFPSISQAYETGHPLQLTAYFGKGVDSNLVEILPKALKGDLEMDNTYLYAMGFFHPLPTPGLLQRAFDFLYIPNTRNGFETVIGKHEGQQYNWEVDANWQLRFASLQLGPLEIKPGVGIGVSYALGRPTYENGSKNDPDKRYRFQNFNVYELEWRLQDVEGVSLVSRIHHRSGIYGLIAPQHVGSNFLTVGLRFSF